MSHHVSARSAAVAVGLLVVAAGCTTLTEEEQAKVDVLEEQADEIGSGGDPFSDRTDEDEACLEEELPGFDGVEAMTDAGAAGVQQRVDITNALITCFPDLGENDSFITSITATFNAALGGVADLSEEEGGCSLRYILDNSDDPGRVLGDGSDQRDVELFLEGAEICFDDESMAIIRGDAGAGPQAIGDDELLDGLATDCSDGSDEACDILYYRASDGSEYFDIAADCAGRGDGLSYCTSGLDLDENGVATAGSVDVLNALRDSCGLEDMTSCDLLYLVAAGGSADEQYGFTCGERIVAGGLPDCRTRFDG